MGHFNQNINANEIIKFFLDLRVGDVCSRINNAQMQDLDKICMHGSNLIDTIEVPEGLIGFVEGSKLLSYDEIAYTSYRAYLIGINLEEYFNEEVSNWDNINHTILCLAKRSYWLKFAEELEE